MHPSNCVFICVVQQLQRVYLDEIKLKCAHPPSRTPNAYQIKLGIQTMESYQNQPKVNPMETCTVGMSDPLALEGCRCYARLIPWLVLT